MWRQGECRVVAAEGRLGSVERLLVAAMRARLATLPAARQAARRFFFAVVRALQPAQRRQLSVHLAATALEPATAHFERLIRSRGAADPSSPRGSGGGPQQAVAGLWSGGGAWPLAAGGGGSDDPLEHSCLAFFCLGQLVRQSSPCG